MQLLNDKHVLLQLYLVLQTHEHECGTHTVESLTNVSTLCLQVMFFHTILGKEFLYGPLSPNSGNDALSIYKVKTKAAFVF